MDCAEWAYREMSGAGDIASMMQCKWHTKPVHQAIVAIAPDLLRHR